MAPMRAARLALASACLLAAGALLAGCGSSSGSTDSGSNSSAGAKSRPAPPKSEFPGTYGRTLRELVKDTEAPTELVVSPAAMVFYKGENRYPFGVFERDRTQIPDAEVALYFTKAPKNDKRAKALDTPAAGPFPAPQAGGSTTLCQTFKYNHLYNEGAAWIAGLNAFVFSNFVQGAAGGNTDGDIIKYTLGGACEVWLHDVGCNGLGVSPSGNLLGACQGPRAVMEYDVTTKMGRMVATMAGGKMLDSPNDLIARSDGNVYFSNTTYELGNRPQGLGSALVRIDPFGVTSVIQMGGLNGVALSPDETKLHVVQMGTWTLDAAGLPGQKGGPTPGGDGIAVDCAGNITNNATNSAYGGPDGKTLIMVGGGTNAKTAVMTVPGLP